MGTDTVPRNFFKLDLIDNIEPVATLDLEQIGGHYRVRGANLGRFRNNGRGVRRPQKPGIKYAAASLSQPDRKNYDLNKTLQFHRLFTVNFASYYNLTRQRNPFCK